MLLDPIWLVRHACSLLTPIHPHRSPAPPTCPQAWSRTNDADQPTSWPQRPTPDTAWSYAAAPGGVPLELQLLLANTLGAQPWLCLPAAADDDYVAGMAAAVAAGLRPDVGVVVELGNELWHTGFPGGQYAQAQGLEMNLTEQGDRWPGEAGLWGWGWWRGVGGRWRLEGRRAGARGENLWWRGGSEVQTLVSEVNTKSARVR